MNNKIKTLIACLLTFIITCSFFLFVDSTSFLQISGNKYPILEKVTKIIENNSIHEFDKELSETAAINAVVSTLGDKYAYYFDEEQALDFFQQVEGKYVGVGIEIFINPENNLMTVLGAFEGSPAYNAGIQTLDRIIKIDGVSYNGDNYTDAVTYMRGDDMKNPQGSEITLTVLRGENDEEISLKMTRETIDTYPTSSKMLDNDIFYVRYSGFSRNSFDVLNQILDNTDFNNINGMIIDLRGNPGGDFDVSIDMCDLFLPECMIMYTEDSDGNKREFYSDSSHIDTDLVVLVDNSSASASEIFAGSLQANNRATIIGQNTYGKGVSQSVIPIDPLGSLKYGVLKITTLTNYCPNGVSIDIKGITPDIEVENITDDDLVLQTAINYLNK